MDPRIAHIIEYMDSTLPEALDVPRLAALAQLSASRFAHLFRAEVGVPPARYLHHRRLQRARELLDTTTLSIREVMTQVGFRDPSHFARDFRRYHGVAPSVLRGRTNHHRPASNAVLGQQVVATPCELAHDAGVRCEPIGDPVKPRSTE